jgi:hypothetical protein
MPNYKPVLINIGGVLTPLLNALKQPLVYDADAYPDGPPPECCCGGCIICDLVADTLFATITSDCECLNSGSPYTIIFDRISGPNSSCEYLWDDQLQPVPCAGDGPFISLVMNNATDDPPTNCNVEISLWSGACSGLMTVNSYIPFDATITLSGCVFCTGDITIHITE